MTNSLGSLSKLLFSTTAGLDLTPTPASFHQEKGKKKARQRAKPLSAKQFSPPLCSSYGEPKKLDPNKCFIDFLAPLSSSFVVQSLRVGEPLPTTTSPLRGWGHGPGAATPSHFLQRLQRPTSGTPHTSPATAGPQARTAGASQPATGRTGATKQPWR